MQCIKILLSIQPRHEHEKKSNFIISSRALSMTRRLGNATSKNLIKSIFFISNMLLSINRHIPLFSVRNLPFVLQWEYWVRRGRGISTLEKWHNTMMIYIARSGQSTVRSRRFHNACVRAYFYVEDVNVVVR